MKFCQAVSEELRWQEKQDWRTEWLTYWLTGQKLYPLHNLLGGVLFSISQGHNQVGIKFFWYRFVEHLLYFVESAADLNEFLYLLLKWCL